MFAQYSREALLLLEEGALPEQVDRVLRAFGFAMGPFHRYDDPHTATPDPALEALLSQHSEERGIVRREISDLEILERCLYAVVNEGARILEQGIAARPLEIDMIWIHGYGFPAHRGGPMFYADQTGLGSIEEAILGYRSRRPRDEDWTPAPLLERLAQAGRGFYAAS